MGERWRGYAWVDDLAKKSYTEGAPFGYTSWRKLVREVADVAIEAVDRGLIDDASMVMSESLDLLDKTQPLDTQKEEWLEVMDLTFLADELSRVPTHKTYDEYALDALSEEVEQVGGVIVPGWHYSRLKNVEERYDRIKKQLKIMETNLESLEEEKEMRLKAETEREELRKELIKRKTLDDVARSVKDYLRELKRHS